MKTQRRQAYACINWRILVLLSVFLVLAYSNSFNASWHLDDPFNITENPRIRISSLSPESLYDAAFENTDGGKLFYRPVAFASFAVNWYFGKADVTGYHAANLSIHILTAFLLYLAVLALFSTPNLSGRYAGSEHFIALLAAVLWAANPVQTQAVTYIVQRMASMAAMFYVLGIYLYVKARTASTHKTRVALYAGVFMAFALAVGSKENALMLPASLLLVEMVFFQNLRDPKIRKRFFWIGGSVCAALLASGVLLFMNSGFIERLQSGYSNRTFTLTERLLTEPRIVVFYLSQFFYPIADRLSIVHDIKISTGLFHPWTTLPAIMFIVGLVGAAFWKIGKYPLISFSILFFFLNHVIESTIIPLELIFEHRNYLPSLFLFVPVAAGIKLLLDYYARENRAMASVIVTFATVLVMVLGIGTYVRNMAWASEYSLWKDALEKAPASARPYHNLAVNHYAKTGDLYKVIRLCEQAMHLYDSKKQNAERLSLVNIASAYARMENYEKAVKLYEKAVHLDPDKQKDRYHLLLALIHTGQLEKAATQADRLLSETPAKIKYLNKRAFIHLKNGEPADAIPYLIKVMQRDPADIRANISLGLVKLKLEAYAAAAHFLQRVPNQSPERMTALLLLTENSVRAGDMQKAEEYAQKLIRRATPKVIWEKLQEANEPGLMWPVAADLVAPVIARQLNKQSKKIAGIADANQG